MSYTFYSFLKELGKENAGSSQLLIEIPYIQRDYVQGRKWESNPDLLAKRDEFINSILNSLIPGNKPLVVDFIYGYKNSNKAFVPLDGQQRLTTLFLLNWIFIFTYTHLHPGSEFHEQLSLLEKFGYTTRTTSQQFCNNLASQAILLTEDEKKLDVFALLKKIEEIIRNQAWFAVDSEGDPTVQAMLQMLSGLGKAIGSDEFRDKVDEMFNTLFFLPKENEKPIGVIFDKLDIHDLHQTDELYVKMNARGKELTQFENWKSEFCDFLSRNYNKKYNDSLHGESYREYFSHTIEHEWTDFFWTYAVSNYKKQQKAAMESNPGTEKYVQMPVIDTYFVNFYQFVNELFFNTEYGGDSLKFKDVESKVKMDVFAQKEEYVQFLFDSLNWFSKMKGVTQLQTFWKDLFYEDSVDGLFTDKVKVFDFFDESSNLFEQIFNGQSPILKLKILVYALLKYCIERKCYSVNDDLKRCMRECRNYLEDQIQYLARTEVSSIMKDEFTSKYKIDVEKIIFKYNGESQPYSDEEKRFNQIEDWNVLSGHLSVFDEIFKDPTLEKEKIQNALLDLFCKNQDLPLARLLISYGYPGCNLEPKSGYEKRFWGSDGARWRVIFLPNPNKMQEGLTIQQCLHRIIKDYLSYAEEKGKTPTMTELEELKIKQFDSLSTSPEGETPIIFRKMMLEYVFINVPADVPQSIKNDWRTWKFPLLVARNQGNVEWLDLILAGNYKNPWKAKHADPFAQYVVYKMNLLGDCGTLRAAKSRGEGKESLSLCPKGSSQRELSLMGGASGWHVTIYGDNDQEFDLPDTETQNRVQTAIDYLSKKYLEVKN